MLKRLVRTSLAIGCSATGLLRWAEHKARQKLTILCYHRVLPAVQKSGYFVPDLVVTPDALRTHCVVMRERFDVRPLSEALAAWRSGLTGSKPVAAITFDDGYRDCFTYAAPILQEAGLRATFFVITGLVGTDDVPWYDRLARAALTWCAPGARRDSAAERWCELDIHQPPAAIREGACIARRFVARAKQLAPQQRRRLLEQAAKPGADDVETSGDDRIMTWEQLRQLTAQGHEIGSHTRTHALLPQLDDVALHEEIAESKQDLETHLRQPCRSFCYPNGDVDERVTRAVATVGYACAVGLGHGSNDQEADVWRLRRWFIHEDRLRGLTTRTSRQLLRLELVGLARVLLARGAWRRWRARIESPG